MTDDEETPLAALVRTAKWADRFRMGRAHESAALAAYERCAQLAEGMGRVDVANAIRKEAATVRNGTRV